VTLRWTLNVIALTNVETLGQDITVIVQVLKLKQDIGLAENGNDKVKRYTKRKFS